jgi:energy-coupling factor transporter transmembrane protein EcfT
MMPDMLIQTMMFALFVMVCTACLTFFVFAVLTSFMKKPAHPILTLIFTMLILFGIVKANASEIACNSQNGQTYVFNIKHFPHFEQVEHHTGKLKGLVFTYQIPSSMKGSMLEDCKGCNVKFKREFSMDCGRVVK